VSLWDLSAGLRYTTGFLERDLKAANLHEFEDVASVARLFASIAMWRHGYVSTTQDTADVGEVGGIVSTNDIIRFLSNHINPKLGRSATYGAPIVTAFAERLRADAKRFLACADGLTDEEGIPIIDEALRRLAGFMRIHKIDFPLPQAPS
jgi:hypothetical protein